MSRKNPDILTDINKPFLETQPCSYIALVCATKDMVVPFLSVHLPKVDRKGYCKLADMTPSIKAHFPNVRYIYVRPAWRSTLSNFIEGHKGTKAIICVQGHFIYFDGTDYYSYFDNDQDTVIAIWMLN